MARLALTVNGMLARLEQSFASLHRFTADASHELKTPLMVLRAGVERALIHPGMPPEILQSLDETLAADQSDVGDGGEPADAGAGRRGPGTARGGGVRPPGRWSEDVAETAGMLGESARGISGATRHPGRAGDPGGGPAPDPGDAPQPRDQRDQVHARAAARSRWAWRGGRTRWSSRSATPVSASPPATCRTSSTGSGGPTRPARAPARGPAPAWDWRSPSGSPRRTAAPSRCRAGPGVGTIFTVRLPREGGARISVGRGDGPEELTVMLNSILRV